MLFFITFYVSFINYGALSNLTFSECIYFYFLAMSPLLHKHNKCQFEGPIIRQANMSL